MKKKWRIVEEVLKNGDLGRCRPKRRQIVINPVPHIGDERERLDTLIHECLHAAFPMLSERAVSDGATFVARLVWKQKYRRVSRAIVPTAEIPDPTSDDAEPE